MNNHREKDSTVAVAIKNAQLASELQCQYGGAHIIRQLPSDAFRKDGTFRRNSDNGDHTTGEVIRLSDVAKSSSTRPPRNGVSWHLYEECNLSVFIPKDAEIKEEKENNDLPARFSVRIGDAFIYISKELSPEPGRFIEGRGDVKVKMVSGKNRKGKLSVYYPFINLWKPLRNGEEPEYVAEFDSKKRYVPERSKDFTPASGSERTILHLDPWDSHIPSEITITIK